MIIRKCDRCGEEIKSDYYYIKIINENNSSIGGVDFQTALRNFNERLYGKKEFCRKCIEDIEKYINKENVNDRKN